MFFGKSTSSDISKSKRVWIEIFDNPRTFLFKTDGKNVSLHDEMKHVFSYDQKFAFFGALAPPQN